MIIQRMEERFPDLVEDRHAFRGDETAVVPAARLLEAVAFAHGEGFQQLVDITAVDWPGRSPRFDVVYHLLNHAGQTRLRLKVRVDEGQAVPSLTGHYKSADWAEREVFDLYGIPFEGHPDLRRLLTWDDFPGHPLRKDFPLDGGDAFCGDTGASYAGDARPLQG